MNPVQNSVTVNRLAREREEDERQVLAENALYGERAISVLRLVTWLMLGIAFSAAEGGRHPEPPSSGSDWLHMAMIGGWFVFALAVFFLLRRVRFTPRRAVTWPILFMLVDFGVFTTLALTTREEPQPQITFATLAILLTYSVARFNGELVWLSAALAIGSYFAESLGKGWFNVGNAVIATAAFGCLATVVWWANRRVRRMFVDVRRRDNLARFVPRQVAQRILEQGGRPLAPASREVTILFSDIRDFTTMSQRMEPRTLLAALDEYFGHMSAVVKGHDGMVNKLIGDGMLALWGVPDAQPDHAERALKAALDMRRVLAELNAARTARGEEPLRIGIGVHTGVVAAGMLGGEDQHEYTVIGDAVNVASRIEGLTKKAGADILASDATWAKCGAKFAGEKVGAEAVKGRDEPVVVWRVEGPASALAKAG